MEVGAVVRNAGALERELAWAERVIKASIRLHFDKHCGRDPVSAIAPPSRDDDGSASGAMIMMGNGRFGSVAGVREPDDAPRNFHMSNQSR
jgi:hypothetical protein